MTDAIVAAAPLLDNICDITKRAIAKILATNLHWTFPSEEERTKLDADRFILNSAHDTWLKDHGPTDRETPLRFQEDKACFDSAFTGGRGVIWNISVRCAYCDAGMQKAADAASPNTSKSQAMLKHFATCPKIP